MNQNLTEMIFILDRSGSMESLAEETIGGFNSLIKTGVPAAVCTSAELYQNVASYGGNP